MNKNIFIVLLVLIVGVLVVTLMRAPKEPVVTPDPQGGNSTQPAITYNNATADNIVVDSPIPGALVQSPLLVTGRARGPWYFEASFPVELRNSSGMVIGQGVAQAQGEWMTEEFVPFSVSISFSGNQTGIGTLILKNDNPSGEPQFDRSVSIPVTF
jgi:hypothetical protein